MDSFFKRHPMLTLFLVNIGLLIVLVIAVEFILKKFAPYNVATIGHKYCENAKLYGWGFSPHEQLRNFDPDSGKAYISYANNHGWRDLDRQFENKKKAYRILELGGSLAFGAIVPAEKMYTRLLEQKLLKEGYNVEVINMSYGSWGTDQHLEALENEGLKYRPNLIIDDFAVSDPGNCSYFYDGSAEKKDWKPFYYELDDKKGLQKKINPYFHIKPHGFKEKIKGLYTHDSEILKHLWATYLIFRFHHFGTYVGYKVTGNKLIALETVIGLKKDTSFYTYLSSQMGKSLTLQQINQAMDLAGYSSKDKEIAARLLEDQLMADDWTKDSYFAKPVDKDSYDWRLYFAIIAEMKRRANSIGADLVLFPVSPEEGEYQLARYWYEVKDDEFTKKNYFSPRDMVKSTMKAMGIDVIENTAPYQRGINDGHPNIKGNETMADDILKYLMLHKKNELEKYRSKA